MINILLHFLNNKVNSVNLLLFILALLLSSCKPPRDISEFDLKSPCVARSIKISDQQFMEDPCIRRTPEGNHYFVSQA